MKTIVFFNNPEVKEQSRLLPKKHTEIGCNYFNQIRTMDHICAYDPHTAGLIPQNSPQTQYWTRNGNRSTSWNELCCPIVYNPQDSGTMAILLAIKLGAKDIYILGCGWGKTNQSIFDHLYNNPKNVQKVSNLKIKLLKRYQTDFKVNLYFVCEPFAKGFEFLHFEDLLLLI